MARYYDELTRRLMRGGFPTAIGSGDPVVGREPPAGRRLSTPRNDKTQVTPVAKRTETVMTHPGDILAQHLHELGLTASDLARDIDVPVNRVTAILNRQRGVTADTALRLGHWFGVGPEPWLDLQLRHELAVAQREAGAKIARLPRLADRRD